MARGLSVFPLADALRRAAYIERTSVKHLCGWFLAARPYEMKHLLGYHAWNHTEHAQWLQERLRFLRGGLAGASMEPSLIALVERSQHAPSEFAYVAGSYLVVKRALLHMYRELLDEADPSANAFDARLLKRLIPEIEEQIAWAEQVLDGDPDPETTRAWAAHMQDVLDHVGGIRHASGAAELPDSPLHRPFTLPERILFDERITDRPLTPHDEKTKLPYEDAVREQFRVFFNEIYAASMLAALLYEAFEHNLDWEFIYDFTRHFWDEVRHSEFGAVRLKELGHEPDRCDQTLFLNSLAMPLLHRVCYLTLVLEPYYMPRKKPRFQEYTEAGDERSRLFADHDWSDEINHVRLGKEWLERLLKDDARDLEQIKEETRQILERRAGAPVDQLSPF